MDFVSCAASVVAAVGTTVLLLVTVKLPYIFNVITSPKTPESGREFDLCFTFATSLCGVSVESIQVQGCRIRSKDYCVMEPELAEAVVKPNWTTGTSAKEINFKFHCYPADKGASFCPVLVVRWRWNFLSRSIKRKL